MFLFQCALIGAGFFLNLRRKEFLKPNLFVVIAALGMVKTLWTYPRSQGVLKSNYLMFLAPFFAIYLVLGWKSLLKIPRVTGCSRRSAWH